MSPPRAFDPETGHRDSQPIDEVSFKEINVIRICQELNLCFDDELVKTVYNLEKFSSSSPTQSSESIL